jgi:hypothetical protein
LSACFLEALFERKTTVLTKMSGNYMTKYIAIIGLLLALPMSNSAHAFIKCDKMDDAKKQKKCEKSAKKSLDKQKKNSEPFQPSTLGKAFASLDAADKNPFASDDFYLGVKTTGIKPVDEFTAEVNQAAATIRMAKYVGHLQKSDASAATALGGDLLPKLIALKDSIAKIQEKGQGLAKDPKALVASPMDIPKAIGAIAGTVPTLAKMVGDLPGAIVSLKSIAGGAAGAAIDKAVGPVQKAMDDAKEAVGQ